MKSRFILFKETRKQFFKYLIFGSLGATSDFIVFNFLISFGISLLIANSVGVLSGVTLSYFLNSKYNFDYTGLRSSSFRKFLTVAFLGYLLSIAILSISFWLFSITPSLSKGLSIPFVALFQFTLNRKWSFRGMGIDRPERPQVEEANNEFGD